MKRVLYLWAMAGVMFAGATVWAEEEIFLRGKEKAVKGVVTKESAQGVSFKDGTTFKAETIEDIVYEVTPVAVRLASYRPAVMAEKESLDPTKSKEHKAKLDEAVKKYADAAAKIQEPFGKRHAEYKAAVLLARQLSEEGKAADPAITALKAFKSKNADSWQIGSALQLLGRLQLDAKDFEGAKATYIELSQASVPDDLRQEAQLQVIHVSIRAGKTAE